MNSLFCGIKYVGFDLDNTLYPKNHNLDHLIRNEIVSYLLKNNHQLKNMEIARKFYDKEYQKIGSWTKILKDGGFSNPKNLMYKFMSNKVILKYIKRDEKIAKILEKLVKKYKLFLITSSPRKIGIKKLENIGINIKHFCYIRFGDDSKATSKIDGKVFKNFLKWSKHSSKNHVYIGDQLRGDILPAKSLGMKTISVGTRIPEADYSVEKIYEIEDLLL